MVIGGSEVTEAGPLGTNQCVLVLLPVVIHKPSHQVYFLTSGYAKELFSNRFFFLIMGLDMLYMELPSILVTC